MVRKAALFAPLAAPQSHSARTPALGVVLRGDGPLEALGEEVTDTEPLPAHEVGDLQEPPLGLEEGTRTGHTHGSRALPSRGGCE